MFLTSTYTISLTGPDSAVGISAKIARGVIRDWTRSIGSPFVDRGRLRASYKTLC
jgi:hypothetical protein